MAGLPIDKPTIWLRSFYGFNPEDDGYIGWTEESHRDRMIGLVKDGDLFMIYGASSAETDKSHRNRVLGFLQVERCAIQDTEKSSEAGMERKRSRGWLGKWSHALPVVRAWRVDESILLERIAPTTYRPEAGQAIAVWSPPLLAEEVENALRIKVSEVSVFGERPIGSEQQSQGFLGDAFKPSRAFQGSFGAQIVEREDGPTCLYLARYHGEVHALLGTERPFGDKSALIKIGVSNDHKRRVRELNSGFPPACKGKWQIEMRSELFAGRKEAEQAEQAFKDAAAIKLKSKGGEFFLGDWTTAQIIFAGLPGVSRFGR